MVLPVFSLFLDFFIGKKENLEELDPSVESTIKKQRARTEKLANFIKEDKNKRGIFYKQRRKYIKNNERVCNSWADEEISKMNSLEEHNLDEYPYDTKESIALLCEDLNCGDVVYSSKELDFLKGQLDQSEILFEEKQSELTSCIIERDNLQQQVQAQQRLSAETADNFKGESLPKFLKEEVPALHLIISVAGLPITVVVDWCRCTLGSHAKQPGILKTIVAICVTIIWIFIITKLIELLNTPKASSSKISKKDKELEEKKAKSSSSKSLIGLRGGGMDPVMDIEQILIFTVIKSESFKNNLLEKKKSLRVKRKGRVAKLVTTILLIIGLLAKPHKSVVTPMATLPQVSDEYVDPIDTYDWDELNVFKDATYDNQKVTDRPSHSILVPVGEDLILLEHTVQPQKIIQAPSSGNGKIKQTHNHFKNRQIVKKKWAVQRTLSDLPSMPDSDNISDTDIGYFNKQSTSSLIGVKIQE